MIQVGLCDDELSVLNQLQILLDRYRVERNQDMVYGAFQSPVDRAGDAVRHFVYGRADAGT